MPSISLRNVGKAYGRNAANAVSDFSLEIGHGEFMCLLGPSGCGKTTTLRLIAGLEHLTAGEIRIGERTVDSVEKAVSIPPERRDLGLVFQSYALWPHMTVEANTEFGLKLRKVPRAERKERIDSVMRALGIEQYRTRYPSQLSGGQQQRVALARMLAVSPDVLLLDEPLSNLDARLRLEMRAELQRLHREFDTTIVFVTHDQWEAMTLATRIAVMRGGLLQQVGSPQEIYERPANRFVAEFVGNPPINIVELEASGQTALGARAQAFVASRLFERSDVAALGIRPESLRLAREETGVPAGALSGRAEVTGILPTGGSWILELTVESEKLFMLTHEAPRLETGSAAHFWAAAESVHAFGAEGQRVAAADETAEREQAEAVRTGAMLRTRTENAGRRVTAGGLQTGGSVTTVEGGTE